TLFLLLGAAAKLGDKHYLQSTQIHPRLDTCYNDVIHDGKVHHVSIFIDTIKNKRYDYTQKLGLEIFKKPIQDAPKQPFLAYAIDKGGDIHKYVREGRHFDS